MRRRRAVKQFARNARVQFEIDRTARRGPEENPVIGASSASIQVPGYAQPQAAAPNGFDVPTGLKEPFDKELLPETGLSLAALLGVEGDKLEQWALATTYGRIGDRTVIPAGVLCNLQTGEKRVFDLEKKSQYLCFFHWPVSFSSVFRRMISAVHY